MTATGSGTSPKRRLVTRYRARISGLTRFGDRGSMRCFPVISTTLVPMPRRRRGLLRRRVRPSQVAGDRRRTRAKTSAGEHQRPFELRDRLGHLDAARAGLGAVERGATTPHPIGFVEDVQALGSTFVAAVEDEPVCVDECGRTEIRAF